MATNYDVLFLRLMVQQGLTERSEALRCLYAIDGAARQGRALNAAQAALELGLTDRGRAEQIHGMVSQQFEQSGEMLRALDSNQAEMEVSAEQDSLTSDSGSVARYFDLSQTGEGLEGYQLGPLLGHGVAGSSFQGRRSDGAPVVVKTLHPRFSDHPEFLQQVLHELKCWLGFRHPNVAATLALGTSHGHSVVVFEHAPGQLVDELLAQRGPLPVEQALAILIDVCRALEAAHQKGLYAGDVRSRKILYDGQTARLTDLGMSRASCLAGGYGGHGVPFGHPAYLAPEVLQEGQTRPQAASDVYALGILFYELLCGRPPFAGEVNQLLEQHLESPLPPPPDNVTFSTAVAGVILRMTAKAADQRVQDVGHLREALEQLQQGRPFRLHVGKIQSQPVEMISAHDWEETSQKQMARESRMWSATAIRKAPLVGPSDIGPTTSTIGGIPMGQVSGRLPPELVSKLRADASSSSVAPARFEAKIGEKLGRGTVGTTYDGRVPSLEGTGPIVIKVVSRKYAKHQEIMDMILGEMRKVKGFRHPNVVPILEVVSAGGRDLVVMPKVAGQTLRATLKERGRLPMLDAVDVVADVARALEAADERGFAHGDIRPEKIYVDSAGSARLADFGHAKAACLGAGLGKHGLYLGDPHYLAPEVLQERQQTPGIKGDMYALGIVFYEMLCGFRPFDGADPKETLLNHLKQPLPPPPKEVVMPQAVARVIMQMTAKDPTKRYGTVAELEAGLQECRDVAAASGEHTAISAASSHMSGSNIDDALGDVEEFDPLASSTAGDVKTAWAERSQVAMKAGKGWSKEKIKKAQKIGPRSWDGPGLDDKPAAALGALYDEMKKASGAHTATKGKGKKGKPEKGKGKGKPAKKPSKGKKGDKVDKKQFATTAGALLAVVAVIVTLVIVDPFGGKEVVRKTTKTGGPVGPLNPPPPPDTDKIKEEAAKIDAALADYEERVKTKLGSGQFKAALAAREELIKPEWQSVPRVKEKLDELETTVQKACNKKLDKERKAIQRLLDSDQLQRAMRRVRKLKTWVVRDADHNQLRDLVLGAQQNATKELKSLATLFGDKKFTKGPAESSLRQSLKGWGGGGQLTDEGGLILDYDSPAVLIKDMTLLSKGRGTKVTSAPAGGSGIHIKAGNRLVVIALKLDLRYVLEATLRFVLKKQAGDDAELALIAGVPGLVKGVGVKWGLTPVDLRTSGNLRATQGGDAVKVPGQQVMMMSIRTAPGRRARDNAMMVGSLTEANTLKVRTGGQRRVLPTKLRGKVAIAVRNVEVWIQGLKVKGLIGKQ